MGGDVCTLAKQGINFQISIFLYKKCPAVILETPLVIFLSSFINEAMLWSTFFREAYLILVNAAGFFNDSGQTDTAFKSREMPQRHFKNILLHILKMVVIGLLVKCLFKSAIANRFACDGVQTTEIVASRPCTLVCKFDWVLTFSKTSKIPH